MFTHFPQNAVALMIIPLNPLGPLRIAGQKVSKIPPSWMKAKKLLEP